MHRESESAARWGGPITRPSSPSTDVVLYLDNSFTFGGALNSLANLVRDLPDGRYAPAVVSRQPESVLRDTFQGRHVRHDEVPLKWVDDGTYRRIRALHPLLRTGLVARLLDLARGVFWLFRYDVPQALRYRGLARSWRASLIHLNNNAESQLPGLLAARLAGIPCVAHARSFQRDRRSTRLHLSLADHHIAISTAVRDNLVELGVEPEEISVIPDGVRVEAMREAADPAGVRVEFDVPECQRVFGLFGRVVPWKGTLEFVEAACEVLQSDPRARAFVVGDPSDGEHDYYETVKRAVRESGVGDRVTLTGYRDDVASLMELMDVVVHASTSREPFGMVLTEAMALGKPVVATRGGGPDDIVTDGETGVLVRPGSPSSLARAIRRLLTDPERSARMGARGAERVERHFRSETSARRVAEVYDRLLPAPPRATINPTG